MRACCRRKIWKATSQQTPGEHSTLFKPSLAPSCIRRGSTSSHSAPLATGITLVTWVVSVMRRVDHRRAPHEYIATTNERTAFVVSQLTVRDWRDAR